MPKELYTGLYGRARTMYRRHKISGSTWKRIYLLFAQSRVIQRTFIAFCAPWRDGANRPGLILNNNITLRPTSPLDHNITFTIILDKNITHNIAFIHVITLTFILNHIITLTITFIHNYIWAMPKYIGFSLLLLFCAGFLRRYFSLSFDPINMKFGHDILRVVRYMYTAMMFLSMFFRIYSGFSGSLHSWKSKGSFCLLVKWADTALCCF